MLHVLHASQILTVFAAVQKEGWNVSDFAVDDDWQRSKRDLFLVPYFYERFYAGRYVLCDGDRYLPMQRRGIDTVIGLNNGTRLTIEEKIVRWRAFNGGWMDAITFEIDSCTVPGYERAGGMVTSEANFLLWCRVGADDCEMRVHRINFPDLKAFVMPIRSQLYSFTMDNVNQTRCVLVHFRLLDGRVRYWPMTIYRDGRIIHSFPEGTGTHGTAN